MPNTRVQSFIFSIIMVFCMVYVMTCYNIARNTGGLTYQVFGLAIKEMWIDNHPVYSMFYGMSDRSVDHFDCHISSQRVYRRMVYTVDYTCISMFSGSVMSADLFHRSICENAVPADFQKPAYGKQIN